MQKIEIIQLDPFQLKPQSFVAAMPRWPLDSNEFAGFKDDIKANGIKHPIQITKDHRVVDGWTRTLAAQAWRLETVPCDIISDDEAVEIIVREGTRRRNLTKGQSAYVYFPLFEEAYQNGLRRRMLNLRNQPKSLVGSQSLSEWCALLGFSRDVLDQAKRLRETFAERPDFAKEWEPKILSMEDPIGLGGALAGIAYKLAIEKDPRKKRGGQPQEEARQLSLFGRSFTDELSRWSYWTDFSEESKQEHFQQVRVKAASLPADQCAQMADYHKRLAEEFRKAAKQREEE